MTAAPQEHHLTGLSTEGSETGDRGSVSLPQGPPGRGSQPESSRATAVVTPYLLPYAGACLQRF